jgi:hypothetical protein
MSTSYHYRAVMNYGILLYDKEVFVCHMVFPLPNDPLVANLSVRTGHEIYDSGRSSTRRTTVHFTDSDGGLYVMM